MNTQENNNNLAAPSVTIAPPNPSKGVLVFVPGTGAGQPFDDAK